MTIEELVAKQDRLLEEIEQRRDEFWTPNIVQILELQRIMETVEQLTMLSSSQEESFHVSDSSSD